MSGVDFAKLPLSYGERVLMGLVKPVILALLFVAGSRSVQPRVKPRRRLKNVIHILTSNDIKLREAREKMKRREWYARKVKLMKENPPLYQAIYGNKVGPLYSTMTLGDIIKSTSSQELPTIKGKFSLEASIKPVELRCGNFAATPKGAAGHRSERNSTVKARKLILCCSKKYSSKQVEQGRQSVWNRLSKRTQVKFLY